MRMVARCRYSGARLQWIVFTATARAWHLQGFGAVVELAGRGRRVARGRPWALLRDRPRCSQATACEPADRVFASLRMTLRVAAAGRLRARVALDDGGRRSAATSWPSGRRGRCVAGRAASVRAPPTTARWAIADSRCTSGNCLRPLPILFAGQITHAWTTPIDSSSRTTGARARLLPAGHVGISASGRHVRGRRRAARRRCRRTAKITTLCARVRRLCLAAPDQTSRVRSPRPPRRSASSGTCALRSPAVENIAGIHAPSSRRDLLLPPAGVTG